jgi:hypothetical protein
MRLVSTSSVGPGQVLARDVVVGRGVGPLLRAGVTLTDGMRASLEANRVARIWVDDALSEGIVPVPLLPAHVRAETLAAVEGLHDATRRALAAGRRLETSLVKGLRIFGEVIADEVVAAAGRAHDLVSTVPAPRYLPNHAVDTAALAVLVARRHMLDAGWRQGTGAVRHDAPRSELDPLGVGVLLCDLGMLRLSRGVLEDARELDAADWEAVREHPTASSDLLDASTSFVLRGIVRGHHERWDGSGYPEGIEGEGVHRPARVTAVADVYGAMTSDRVHQAAMPSAEAWSRIQAASGRLFDPGVVAAFCAVVAKHPVGHEVRLADGRTGVVSAVDLGPPQRIAVRVQEGGRIVELQDATPAP